MFESTQPRGLRPVLRFLLLAVLVLVSGTAAVAQPLIAAAHADPNTNTLVMDGTGFSTAPIVTLGTYVTPLSLVTATSTHIVAQLPAGIAAGGYLLTVRNPASPDRSGPAPGWSSLSRPLSTSSASGPTSRS